MRDKAGWENSRAANEHARRVASSSLSSSMIIRITSGGRIRQRGGVLREILEFISVFRMQRLEAYSEETITRSLVFLFFEIVFAMTAGRV